MSENFFLENGQEKGPLEEKWPDRKSKGIKLNKSQPHLSLSQMIFATQVSSMFYG